MLAAQLQRSASQRASRRSDSRSASESRSRRVAATRPRGSFGSKRQPLTPSVTMSVMPPALAAITGQPAAIASSRTSPSVSVRDGKTSASADANAEASRSPLR